MIICKSEGKTYSSLDAPNKGPDLPGGEEEGLSKNSLRKYDKS